MLIDTFSCLYFLRKVRKYKNAFAIYAYMFILHIYLYLLFTLLTFSMDKKADYKRETDKLIVTPDILKALVVFTGAPLVNVANCPKFSIKTGLFSLEL